jgi:orotate phosphoribosyltransferase
MNEILDIFKRSGALLQGHFRLTSGLHSPTYFQCALVLQYPQYCQLLAQKIVDHFSHHKIDTVLSPAIGGIVIGQEVGRQLGIRTIFAERKGHKMELRRGFTIQPGERIFVCEDVVTTGGSVFEVLDLIKQNDAQVIGIGYIVDRSNGKIRFGVPQFSIIQLDIELYQPESCPLCKDKIPIVKPGSRA